MGRAPSKTEKKRRKPHGEKVPKWRNLPKRGYTSSDLLNMPTIGSDKFANIVNKILDPVSLTYYQPICKDGEEEEKKEDASKCDKNQA